MESNREVGDIEDKHCKGCGKIKQMRYDGAMINPKDAIEFPQFRGYSQYTCQTCFSTYNLE